MSTRVDGVTEECPGSGLTKVQLRIHESPAKISQKAKNRFSLWLLQVLIHGAILSIKFDVTWGV